MAGTLMAFSQWSLVLAIFSPVLAEECPQNSLGDFYAELGCLPKFENESKCPTSYDCTQHETRDRSKCHYLGHVYNTTEDIGNVSSSACSAACYCQESERASPTIACASVECFEHFSGPPETNCYYAYGHDSCCSHQTVCRKKEEAAAVTCKVGNETYYEGEHFYTEEEPCTTCICMGNFTGKIEEPFCRKVECHTQLRSQDRINRGCVPVYYGHHGCCPIDWKCPETDDKVRKATTKESSKTAEKCTFGKLVLEPGESVESAGDSTSLECTCKLPPYLTCFTASA